MGVHDGHRERMKARFLKQGLSGFEPHEVLELALFFTRPRGNTNEIAHNLLKKFKTISAVLDAAPEELITVDGVGENTAVFLKLLPQLFAVYRQDKLSDEKIITGTDAAGKYFIPLFLGKKCEEVYMLSLDDKHKIIRCTKLFEGSVNAAPITVKKVVAEAVNTNATTVIIAHNHPGGIALPSSNDKIITRKLFTALDLINIRLEDHIIVADEDYVSLADSGFFSELRS